MEMEMFDRNLPPHLAHDLEALKKGAEEKSHLLDCLWRKLYSSINIAEINDGFITHDQAQCLRDKYLWRKGVCACRDFTAVGHVLYDFCSIKNTVIDSETNCTGTELADVPSLSDFQRRFYKTYLATRYEVLFA